jgi:hypothetical protein
MGQSGNPAVRFELLDAGIYIFCETTFFPAHPSDLYTSSVRDAGVGREQHYHAAASTLTNG